MWKTDVWGILLHPTQAKVWILPSAQGYRLPSFTLEYSENIFQNNHLRRTLPVILGLQEAYSCDLYLMQTMNQWEDPKNQQSRVVCVFEIKERHPTHGEWMDIQTMASRSFAVDQHGELVSRVLDELEEGRATPPEFPWQRRGWFKQVVRWIERELSKLDYGPVTNVEQLQTSIYDVLLRVHADQAVFYFKTMVDLHWLANESMVADTLGARYPHLIPKPVCIDAGRRWMLTAAFGPTLENPKRDKELLVQAAHAFGQMQLDSAAHLTDLLETDTWGCDLQRLPFTWEKYLRESKVMKLLEAEEVAALQRYLPQIKEYIGQLADSPIPQTIVHGDFGPYNIAQRDGKPLIFDWTHVGISFPFFDMVELLHRVRPLSVGGDTSVRTPEVDAIKDRIKTAYLEAWTACAPMSELEKLWTVAEPLGFVSMALHLSFPYFPRRVLRYLEQWH